MGVSRQFGADLKEIDGVDIVSAQQFGAGQVTYPDGTTSDQFIGALDPTTFGDIFKVQMDTGELTDLGGGGVLVDRRTAEEQELGVGDEVTITGPTGAVDTFRIDAISDDMTMLGRSEAHTSELPSPMRISSAAFCL